MEEQQTAPPFPLSSSEYHPEHNVSDETRETVNRLAILAEHSVENLQANEQHHGLYEPENPGQHHDLNGREHEAHQHQIDQHQMDPELHDPQQQQQHLPPSMTEALDQQNLEHLRHAEGLLSFANESGNNEYYTSQDNLSRMLEAQTVDTLGEGNMEGGAHGASQLDENGYPLDPGLNNSIYATAQDAQHAALMAAEHGGHMMDGVDGMDDYHSTGSSGRMMDGGRKRKRTTKETVPAEAVKLKKDVHKEVERKRRAVINEGVAAIAAVLPTNEKQKGMILAQAAQYIRQLQENERINTNSWAEEKGMLEQDIADLRSQLQLTQARLEQEHAHFERIDLAWREAEDRAASLQSELDRLRRRLAGETEGDHTGADHEGLDDALDNAEDFAIETTEGMTENLPTGEATEQAARHEHDEQDTGGYAVEPTDADELGA
ncbi:basic helix-loop-helix protein [Naganishia albida]|nr:basic helix-loop-helix protein [Naganishia albida]